VPGWILAPLARGLRAEPAERWPSMNALLDALSRDPRRRRWLALTATGVLAALGTGVVLYRQAVHAQAHVCEDAPARLVGIWDATRRAEVERAFGDAGAGAFRDVAAALDRYTEAWSAARADACRDTRVRGVQSEELLDLRMSCLDGHLDHVRAAVSLLARGDAQITGRAAAVTGTLPPLGDCADVRWLHERLAPPRDPAKRARVEELSRKLNDLEAVLSAYQNAEAMAQAQALAAEAATLDYPPLSAEAHKRLGDALEHLGRLPEAEAEYEATALDAQRGRDDLHAQRAWEEYARFLGIEEHRPEEGLRALRVARAEYDRRGKSDPVEELWIEADRAELLQAAGRTDEALAVMERIVDRARTSDQQDLRRFVTNLALLDQRAGRQEQALASLREVLALTEREAPDDTAELHYATSNVGQQLSVMHRYADALPFLDRALATAEKAFRPGHPRIASVLDERAYALGELGRWPEALDDETRALAVAEALEPPSAFRTGRVLAELGRAELELGRAADAVPHLQRAIALLGSTPRGEHDAADARFVLARALYAAGDHAGGRAAATAALPVLEAADAQQARDWLASHPL
jgi:tetratricopeptide (TPR) repeat protein